MNKATELRQIAEKCNKSYVAETSIIDNILSLAKESAKSGLYKLQYPSEKFPKGFFIKVNFPYIKEHLELEGFYVERIPEIKDIKYIIVEW